MHCNLVEKNPNKPNYLTCTRCLTTIDTEIFCVDDPIICKAWFDHDSQQEVPTDNKENTHPLPKAMESPAPTKLAVVSCYFNFANYRSIRQNFQRFNHEMAWWSVPYYSIAVNIKGHPRVASTFSIDIDLDEHPEYLLWQKEQLLNLVIEQVPKEFDAIAWVDADVLFLKENWYNRTLDMLATKPVGQMWRQWHFAGRDGELNITGHGVGEDGFFFKRNRGHPGGAWAARRQVLPLYPYHIVGGGDTLTVSAWLNVTNAVFRQYMSQEWYDHYFQWAKNQYELVAGEIGTLKSDCMHLYHGSRENRQYSNRNKWLSQNKYDPTKHVTIANNGLIQWTKEAPPNLVNGVAEYLLYSRKEDDAL